MPANYCANFSDFRMFTFCGFCGMFPLSLIVRVFSFEVAFLMFGLKEMLCVTVVCVLVPKAYAADENLKGKYQLNEFGNNATGSHSHVSSSYLVITDDSAIYFSTDNGDVIGNKELLSFKTNGKLVGFFYKGCLETDLDNIDKSCTPEKPLDAKRYVFEKTKKGLVLKWGGFTKGDIYQRVKKFDFE